MYFGRYYIITNVEYKKKAREINSFEVKYNEIEKLVFPNSKNFVFGYAIAVRSRRAK